MKKLLSILFLLFAGSLAFGQLTTNLYVTSSNSFVVDKFNWGINKAFSYVKIGTPVAGYAAAMDTATFCAHDVAHMAEGAHLLGLDAENWSMLHLFAYGANRRAAQDYYWPRWHYHFNGSDSADLGSCQWRCLPTTFDVMQSSYRQYLWTGNDDWINDTEFETYYSNTHDYTKFMQHQDVNSNGVADETIQLATYWEQSPDNFIEAGDAITYQYMALVDYSKILEAKGDMSGAATFAQKAADLKTHFETVWYSNEDNMYIRGFDAAGNSKTDWGKTVSYITTPINVGETIIVEASNPVNTGIIYLSDINWTSNTNESNTKKDFNTAGNLLFMDGVKSYEKGLGVISNTEITYDISGLGYKSFITDIGIDDEVEDQGSVTFEIWVDGVKTFDKWHYAG